MLAEMLSFGYIDYKEDSFIGSTLKDVGGLHEPVPLCLCPPLPRSIPAKGSHLIRYYGWYSNKSRDMRKKAEAESSAELWAAGCGYGQTATTTLARMTRDSYEPALTLPSGGDCSYPGVVWHDDLLWMSYYSSHEGKTSIYRAKFVSRTNDSHEGR